MVANIKVAPAASQNRFMDASFNGRQPISQQRTALPRRFRRFRRFRRAATSTELLPQTTRATQRAPTDSFSPRPRAAPNIGCVRERPKGLGPGSGPRTSRKLLTVCRTSSEAFAERQVGGDWQSVVCRPPLTIGLSRRVVLPGGRLHLFVGSREHPELACEVIAFAEMRLVVVRTPIKP